LVRVLDRVYESPVLLHEGCGFIVVTRKANSKAKKSFGTVKLRVTTTQHLDRFQIYPRLGIH
jgi:hypothetical protein